MWGSGSQLLCIHGRMLIFTQELENQAKCFLDLLKQREITVDVASVGLLPEDKKNSCLTRNGVTDVDVQYHQICSDKSLVTHKLITNHSLLPFTLLWISSLFSFCPLSLHTTSCCLPVVQWALPFLLFRKVSTDIKTHTCLSVCGNLT